jgi:hypothetical protein
MPMSPATRLQSGPRGPSAPGSSAWNGPSSPTRPPPPPPCKAARSIGSTPPRSTSPRGSPNPQRGRAQRSPFGLGSVARFLRHPAVQQACFAHRRDAIAGGLPPLHPTATRRELLHLLLRLPLRPARRHRIRRDTMGHPRTSRKLRAAVKLPATMEGRHHQQSTTPCWATGASSPLTRAQARLRRADGRHGFWHHVARAPQGAGGAGRLEHLPYLGRPSRSPTAISYFTRGRPRRLARLYISPEAERLVGTWMSATTETTRQTAFEAAQRLALDDVASFPRHWRPGRPGHAGIINTTTRCLERRRGGWRGEGGGGPLRKVAQRPVSTTNIRRRTGLILPAVDMAGLREKSRSRSVSIHASQARRCGTDTVNRQAGRNVPTKPRDPRFHLAEIARSAAPRHSKQSDQRKTSAISILSTWGHRAARSIQACHSSGRTLRMDLGLVA